MAKITTDKDFKDAAFAFLKKAHGDKFDEKIATEMADDLLKKADGDYGQAIGMMHKSMHENTNNKNVVSFQEWNVLHEAKMHRPISEIAMEISRDWKNVNYAAKPYLEAMYSLNSIKDRYGMDSGSSIVAYFLSNASQYKGETAKVLKAELKAMLK